MSEWEEHWTAQQSMLANRLRKNKRRLKSWLRREQVSCYRLYDCDIPEIPFAIDVYDDHLHISEYRRRHSYSEEEHAMWAEWMLESIRETVGIERDKIFVKLRQRQKGRQQYEKVSEETYRIQVEEGGHQFWINLSDYLDTGLFLDHRITRRMVGEESNGKRLLNLFAYTGSFTVYAAAAGATHTTTVDMSRTYLRWTQKNLELNHLWGEQHRLIHSDVFAFLQEQQRSSERYDLIVLDPPTYSASKRMEGTLDIQRDHVWLLERGMALLAPGGTLYFSTNFRKFQLDEEKLQDIDMTEITSQTIPPDFRDRIHRCWTMCRTQKTDRRPANSGRPSRRK